MCDTVRVHGTTVSFDGRGVLIRGASGAGKSALALQLLAYGAQLVSDDQTALTRTGTTLRATAPQTTKGLIEARGIGLMRCDTVESVDLALVIDMDVEETARLPEPKRTDYLGVSLPLVHKTSTPAFPAAILQYLKVAQEPDDD